MTFMLNVFSFNFRHVDHGAIVLFTLNQRNMQLMQSNPLQRFELIHVMFVLITQLQIDQDHLNDTKMNIIVIIANVVVLHVSKSRNSTLTTFKSETFFLQIIHVETFLIR